MTDTRFNKILETLGSSIESINGKIATGKQNVTNYKLEIIKRLKQVVEQLKTIKENEFFNSIPILRGELESAQAALKAKTDELAKTRTELDKANYNISELQKNIDTLNAQLKQKNEELNSIQEELKNQQTRVADKDKIIADLNKQIEDLNAQRADLQGLLNSSRAEIDGLIAKLTDINNALVQKIGLIDKITEDLKFDPSDDVSQGFQLISDNIAAILRMINSSETRRREPTYDEAMASARMFTDAYRLPKESKTDLYDKFNELDDDARFEIYKQIRDSDSPTGANDADKLTKLWESGKEDTTTKNNIQYLLNRYRDILPTLKGGKRRSRTIKRHGKKSRKTRKIKTRQKGGYVYSSSKDLDRASSVVSSSAKTSNSSASSVSKSKTRKDNLKKRRVTRKHKSNK